MNLIKDELVERIRIQILIKIIIDHIVSLIELQNTKTVFSKRMLKKKIGSKLNIYFLPTLNNNWDKEGLGCSFQYLTCGLICQLATCSLHHKIGYGKVRWAIYWRYNHPICPTHHGYSWKKLVPTSARSWTRDPFVTKLVGYLLSLTILVLRYGW